jgi:hypothetical protein
MDGSSVGWRVNAFSGLEMNVSGGIVFPFFDAYSGSETNISGGRVRSEFEAKTDSLVNISGGIVDDGFTAGSGSEVNISGGAIGFSFNAESGSDVELFGGEFKLNGDAFTGPAITLSEGDMFSGTLTDGSAFIFSSHNVGSDRLVGVTLTSTAVPALNATPIVVNTRFPNRPSGLRAGQTLTLEDGGALGDYFEAVGATLNIKGGSLGSLAGVSQSQVNISGGIVGPFFDAYSGSVVNISGGSVGSGFEARSGSEVNISGGSIDQFSAQSGSVVNISGGAVDTGFDARSGSEVNISGGTVGSYFEAYSGSVVNISGGTVGHDFMARSGSVDLSGGDFKLNGDAFAGSSITLSQGDVISGRLSDGTGFIFSSANDFLSGVTLTSTALPAIDTTPIVVNTDLPTPAPGLVAGQVLTLQDGGQIGDDFEVVDAILNVEGGSLGDNAGVAQSEVNVSGGTVGHHFDAFSGSVVNISGGAVGTSFDAHSGSEVNISGGTVGTGFNAFSGSEVNINGGSIGSNFEAYSGSVVNISGGNVAQGFIDEFDAVAGSKVNVFGTEFLLDSVQMESLVPGEAFIITEREVLLSGLLADGTSFDFGLWVNSFRGHFFDPEATLTVTLVEEGDFNFDGDIDGDDVDYYIGSIDQAATGEYAKLDLDDDGMVTLADHDLHVSTLVTTSNGVTGALLGDVNLDGTVDVLGDAFAFVGNLGMSATSRAQGDLNADGIVDILGDGFILIGDLGSSTNPTLAPATTAVPEPGCMAIFVVGVIALSVRRRRNGSRCCSATVSGELQSWKHAKDCEDNI